MQKISSEKLKVIRGQYPLWFRQDNKELFILIEGNKIIQFYFSHHKNFLEGKIDSNLKYKTIDSENKNQPLDYKSSNLLESHASVPDEIIQLAKEEIEKISELDSNIKNVLINFISGSGKLIILKDYTKDAEELFDSKSVLGQIKEKKKILVPMVILVAILSFFFVYKSMDQNLLIHNCTIKHKPGACRLMASVSFLTGKFSSSSYYLQQVKSSKDSELYNACNKHDAQSCYLLAKQSPNDFKTLMIKSCNLSYMKACIALAKKEQEDGHIEAAKNIFVDLCQNKLNPEGCYLAKNFQKACDMGYGMGCLEIGVQHFNKLEYTQAIPFLEKACEQDTNSACFRLEKTKSRKKAKEVCMNSPKRCLIFADYLARDSFTKESYFYYKKACDNGNDEACTKLKK